MPWSRLPTPDGADDGPEPAPLGDVLDRVLGGMGAPTKDVVVELHARWGDIVGDELAGHASPQGIADGVLKVAVDSPAWASHLRWSEADVLRRIDAVLGAGHVRSLTTRIVRS